MTFPLSTDNDLWLAFPRDPSGKLTRATSQSMFPLQYSHIFSNLAVPSNSRSSRTDTRDRTGVYKAAGTWLLVKNTRKFFCRSTFLQAFCCLIQSEFNEVLCLDPTMLMQTLPKVLQCLSRLDRRDDILLVCASGLGLRWSNFRRISCRRVGLHSGSEWFLHLRMRR